jgi:hypothetical protein
MQVNWEALLQGTVTGLVGAAVLAALAASRNFVRNILLKRRIRRDLDSSGVGSGITGITTTVRNETEREMVVRQVAFLMDENFIVLLPSRELTSSYEGQSPKLTRAEIRRIKQGEMIQGTPQMQFASWQAPISPGGFVSLAPYTKTSFVLPADFVANSTASIQLFRFVIEYVTRTGDKKILQHDVKPKHPKHVQKTLEHLREEIRSGTFNDARRRFGMPEITVRPRPDSGPGP